MARSERREVLGSDSARSHKRSRGVRLHAHSLGKVPRWIVAVALSLSVSACTRTGRGANAADAERQSESEYDVARDLFLSRHDPRGALGHAEKAIELNDQNAEAHH